MSSGCGDVLSLADLQTAKKHQVFEAEVITGKSGGVAGGADIDYATNQVTGQTQKTLPAVLRDAGFSPVSWDFSTGGTLTVNDRDKVVYDPVSKTWYSWSGALPRVVAAGTDPRLDMDWIPRVDPSVRTDLDALTIDYNTFKDKLASDSGVSLIGSWTSPEAFGVVPDNQASAHSNSKALFNMFESIRSAGRGVVWLKPGATYWVDFINFIPSNTIIMGNGATIKHIDPLSSYGRGGLVIGSSREFNYDSAKTAYLSNTYPSSVSNSGFTDPAITQYLEFNQSFVQAQNVIVRDLRMEAVFTLSTSWGGYALNVVNAQHVRIYNLTAKGWTEAVNIGSDTAPSTPSCYDVICDGVYVESGDLVRTYYAIGFIANSTECEISNGVLATKLTDGTQNGSAVSLNVCERCRVRNIDVPNLGLTVSSEGVLLNNAKNCIVENIDIKNCVSVMSTYYTLAAFSGPSDRNTIRNVNGSGSYLISLRAKNATISSFAADDDTTVELYFANNNATNNVIKTEPKNMVFGGTNTMAFFLQNNNVKGWNRRYLYIRPNPLLMNDMADTSALATADIKDNAVASKASVDLRFLWQVPNNVKAIDDIRTFITWSSSAQSAGSNIEISLVQEKSFDGNLSETPYVAVTNNKTADGSTDTTLVAQPVGGLGLIRMDDSTNGLPYSFYLRARMTNNVNFNYIKQIRVAVYM